MNRELFRSMVPDSGMAEYILNGRDVNPNIDPFRSNAANYSMFFNNVVNLAFMYAFSCYKEYANRNYSPDGEGMLDKYVRGGNSNSARVLSNMKKIYNGYPITNELVQYILLDIYFDFELGEDDSHLRDVFPNFINTSAGVHLDEVFSIINKTLLSSRARAELKLKDVKIMLQKLLNLFPFISTTKLVYVPERQWYAFVLDENEHYPNFCSGMVNTFGMITRIDNGADNLYYYLADISLSDTSNGTLKYVLVGTDNFVLCHLSGESGDDNGFSQGVLLNPFEIPHDEEYYFSLLCPDRLESIKPAEYDYSIEQLFNIKYKYIKNLALAIADTLGRSSTSDNAQQFKKEFEKDFPAAFSRYDKSINNWDTVVLMLLIETSPSYVLQKLFLSNNRISDSTASTIIKNLKKRFGREFSANLGLRLFNSDNTGYKPYDAAVKLQNIASNHVRISSIRSEQLKKINASGHHVQSYDELMYDCIAEKMADILLSAISQQNDNEPVQFCIGNSKQNIEVLEVLRLEQDPTEKCKGIYRAFGELLIKLCCFYEGIYAYGKIKRELDTRASARMLTSSEIEAYQSRAEKTFSEAARKKFEEIEEIKRVHPENALLPILSEFVDTCESCYKYNREKKTFERKDESYHLYSVLGKNNVLQVRALKDEIDGLPELNEESANRWIDEAMKLIRFFRTGVMDSRSNDIELFLSITPFIASYNKGSYNKDGYHTAMFSLVFNTGDTAHRQKEVNVLSEMSYNMNSKYYCMPNIVTSTDKWWIDPFIIKCQAFDEIFTER